MLKPLLWNFKLKNFRHSKPFVLRREKLQLLLFQLPYDVGLISARVSHPLLWMHTKSGKKIHQVLALLQAVNGNFLVKNTSSENFQEQQEQQCLCGYSKHKREENNKNNPYNIFNGMWEHVLRLTNNRWLLATWSSEL